MHRTTIRLDEHLLAEAKQYASRNRRTLTSVIEDALRALLVRGQSGGKVANATAPKPRLRLPVSKETGGPLPGANIDSYSELLDLMEEGLPLDKRR